MSADDLYSIADGATVPTPRAGQMWHSTAFPSNNPEGRVDVLAVVETRYGTVVVEHLVRGGSDLGAKRIEHFLACRTCPAARRATSTPEDPT